MYTVLNNGSSVPQSFITKGKQRLKQYVDTVYLENGDEFEIELFNPTQNKILAKIELNGNDIGNGIVLRPGERVFLERYIDDVKKFKFDTYFVNTSNNEVLNAISKNGDVIVKFYNEHKFTTSSIISPFSITGTGTATSLYAGTTSTGTVTFNTATSTCNTVNASVNYNDIETGRIEKGSESNQKFGYDNSSFYTFPFANNWWKIKPKSTKVLTKEDLVVYCTECGSKRKKDKFKFCPHCGTKF
jgi:hypothetical protein